MKERQLVALANIDAKLCASVAAGLGLHVPDPTVSITDAAPSPALSQLGKSWPVDGRVVGIIVDENTDLSELEAVRHAIDEQGMLPLVIAATGGELVGTDGTAISVQRSLLTAKSVEFDAVIFGGAPPVPGPAPTFSSASVDAKVAAGETAKPGAGSGIDPRVRMLFDEAFRHAKVIGAWGDGIQVLDGVTGPGIVTTEGSTEVVTELVPLLAEHRVWKRLPAPGVTVA